MAPAVEPSTAESPAEKVHRLANELADALNYFLGGSWSATVFPSEDARRDPLSFSQNAEPRCRHLH